LAFFRYTSFQLRNFLSEFVDDAWRKECRETGKQPKEGIFVVPPAHIRLKRRKTDSADP
jgi:hypothetical protein